MADDGLSFPIAMFIPLLRTFFVATTLLLAPSLFAASKIGVLLKARSPFWAAIEKGALETGEKLGVTVISKAPLAESDISVQIQMLNALGAQGVEAIVIA